MSIRSSVAALALVSALGCSRPDPAADKSVVVTITGLMGAPANVWIAGVAGTPGGPPGVFRFERVDTPYDLVVGMSGLVSVYQGVTRRDPVVNGASDPGFSTMVSGFVSGDVRPQPAGGTTAISVGSPNGPWNQNGGASSDGTFQMSCSWSGTNGLESAVVRGLQARLDQAGVPVEYLAFGAKALTLSPSTALTGVQVPLSPVSQTGRVQGDAVVPSGWTLHDASARLYWPDHGAIWLFHALSPAFDFATPVVDGALVALSASAAGPGNEWASCTRANVATTASGVRIALPVPPALMYPPDSAIVSGPGSRYIWSATQAGARRLRIGSATAPEINLYTAGDDVTLPDLRAYGIRFSPTTCSWSVTVLPFGTVDDVLARSYFDEPREGCEAWSVARAIQLSFAP